MNVDLTNSGLDHIIGSQLKLLGIDGLSSPYPYLASSRSTFNLHVEDQNLSSLSEVVKELLNRHYSKKFECPGFHRHKLVMIDPNVLRKFNVPVFEAEQGEGSATN